MDVFLWVFHLQKEHLGDDDIGYVIVDIRPNEDNTILQKARVNVQDPFTTARVFDDVRRQRGVQRLLAHLCCSIHIGAFCKTGDVLCKAVVRIYLPISYRHFAYRYREFCKRLTG
jgi:hypothetical protein